MNNLSDLNPSQLRSAFRNQTAGGQTSGLAYGYVQANLTILPAHMAEDFRKFCELNPRPCPIIGVSAVGDGVMRELGDDIDVRTDVSAYRVFKDGKFSEEVSDISALWRDDFVAFALGCSFSFEEALMNEGFTPRHIELGRNVPMYRSSIDLLPAGPFAGKMVVSMRPFLPEQAKRVAEITAMFPRVHGGPIHIGNPEEIGIKNILKPDFGDEPQIKDGEIPIFWACGVTPQVAIENARPEICITHKPGHMLISDLLNSDFVEK